MPNSSDARAPMENDAKLAGSGHLEKSHTRGFKTLCLMLLLLAACEFTIRGPVRAIRSATGFNDFLSPYIQAHAWRIGLDPYSPQVLLRLWPRQAQQFLFLPKEVASGTSVVTRGLPTAYPITALVLLAPFSLLPWPVAYGVWLALNLALFAGMVAALLELAGLSYGEPRGLLLMAGMLALAPFHTALVTANPTLLAVELSIGGILFARRRQEISAAVLVGLATGLKPQIGLVFLVYFLLRRRWRIFLPAAAGVGCLAGMGLLRLEISHTSWLANYLHNNQVQLETGVLGIFTPVNPIRFGLIHLQVALYPMLGNSLTTNQVALTMGAVLSITWFALWLRRHHASSELLDLSAIAVISLLPVYHRFYDACLLALPLCWAFVWFRRKRALAILSGFLLLPFLVPGGTVLQTLVEIGRIPAGLANRWWWQSFVMAHEVWLLLLLSILLLYGMATNAAEVSPQRAQESAEGSP